jgi:8-oxo-dGTP diphosphatase
VTVVAALVQDSSGGACAARLFLARRTRQAGHGGRWELPGGKLEPDESPEAALVREIREELGVGLVIEGEALRYESAIEGRAFLFLVYPARFIVGEGEGFALAAHDECRYFSAAELAGLELAPLDGPALRDWAAQKE